jgi:hypothetical protein
MRPALRHHALHTGAHGQTVAMSTVGRSDVITFIQGCTNTDRTRLLTFTTVQSTINIANGRLIDRSLLKRPDALHVNPKLNQLLVVDGVNAHVLDSIREGFSK